MKRFILVALAAGMMFMGGTANAQSKYGADSAECIKYLSYYKEYYKQKNYNESMPNWRKAFKLCPPTASQNMIIDGTTMVRRLVGTTKDAAMRKSLVDTLLNLHELRAQYYPKYAVTSINNKGTDISNYLKGDDQAVYDGLNDVISRLGVDTKPSLLLLDLNAAITLYQAGKLEPEDIINKYQACLALIGEMNPASDTDKEMTAKAKSDIEGLFINSKVASCENLIALFTPRFEAKPDDIDLVSNIVRMLSSSDDCTDNELYLKAATAMHKLQPSAQSAYFLYRLNASRGNVDDAVSYMEEALAAEDLDNENRAAYNYEFATFCVKNSRPAKGFAAAQKALEIDESYAGKAYFLMGTIWGTTSCSGDEISKRAPYWVACDYMQKAKAADATLADECNRMIGQYSVYFPKTADAFMFDLTNGQSYTVSCGGMRAVTTVRTQK